MNDIEAKALALVNKVSDNKHTDARSIHEVYSAVALSTALCRAIEQHEAFKQEVSREMEEYSKWCKSVGLQFPLLLERFIIPKPKPDPLVDVLADTFGASLIDADELRAALEARGLEIREKI
jgi:hypothetical protein